MHKAKNAVEIIFTFYNIFQMALDIIQSNKNLEPQNVEECQKRNYLPKWKNMMYAELQLLIKQKVSRLVVQTSKSIKLVGYKWVFVCNRANSP